MNVLDNTDLIEEDISIYRELEDVVSALKKAKEENINVNLLIGAGCSVTANIPAAQGMVDTIRTNYPGEFKRARIKDYPSCMSKLTPSERKNLISQTVKDAKVNWTHIAIAQLLKHGYINRILTPNFDNLVQRACALVGEFPGIYDLTTSSEFKKDLLFDKSVIHLHGQHTGFILCNTEAEVEEQFQTLKPVFQQLDEKSLWIVIGYSGNNDPIFKLLSNKTVFEHRLFWIGYEDNKPAKMLNDELLSEEKYAFFVKGFNSDDFFVRLSQQLDCFPPTFIQQPFTYLSETLDTLAPYKIPTRFNSKDVDSSNDLQILTKNVVHKAIISIENDKALMAQHYLMAGLFDETINVARNTDGKIDLELELQVINAFRQKGNHTEAIERLNNLNNDFPDSYEIIHQLAAINLLVSVTNISTEPTKEIALEQLQLALHLFEKSFNISPSRDSIQEWEIHLLITHRELCSINNDKLQKFLFESINIFLKSLTNFLSDPTAEKVYYTNIPSIISTYIDSEQFDYAKNILEIAQNLKLIPLFHAELMASWGLWYFRNTLNDFNTSLENAVNYYTKGLKLLERSSEIDSYTQKFNNMKQSFLFEHAKFLLKHNQQKEISIRLLNECIQFSEQFELDNAIQKEAIKILETLSSQDNTISQIASTTSPN
ncbi:hypothetical protein [Bacillus toyonensis]|uniref:hypothetical protein n=1 Tax=Bacillus toyonensis TaxID=155322 RepID=UPI0020D284FE|nr:hypothetical protein [Bacillus toyonensis]